MDSNFKFKTDEMPLNNEIANIASYKSKEESKHSEKYSSNKLLNHNSVKDAVENYKDAHHIQRQDNKFHTEKFERKLKESAIINSVSPSCEDVNNTTENNYSVSNQAGKGITNIFTEKVSESELSNDQLKTQAINSPDKSTEMTDIITAPTVDNKLVQGINDVSESFEYETDSSEEYEIFQAGPSRGTSTAKYMPRSLLNEQEQESRHRRQIEMETLKTNKQSLDLRKPGTSTDKNKEDFELLIEKFKNDNYLAKDIFLALSGECLRTGITQTKVLQYLKERGMQEAVKLKRDIKVFFDEATKAGIIKSQKRRFYLNVVDNTVTQHTHQDLKRKFVNDNNDSKNYGGDNSAKKRNDLASSSITSNDESQLYQEKEKQIEIEKNGANIQNNSESSDLTKIMPRENNIKSKTERVTDHLKTHKTNIKNAEVFQHQENDFRKTMSLNMIKAARSRREGIKFRFS